MSENAELNTACLCLATGDMESFLMSLRLAMKKGKVTVPAIAKKTQIDRSSVRRSLYGHCDSRLSRYSVIIKAIAELSK